MTHGPVRVGSAFPDRPFDVDGTTATGLDHDLVQRIFGALGRPIELHRYRGADFDGIFGGLGDTIDVVASGATITDHRRQLARWCSPYVESGQSLVVNPGVTPEVHSTDDLAGLVLGVQRGNGALPTGTW